MKNHLTRTQVRWLVSQFPELDKYLRETKQRCLFIKCLHSGTCNTTMWIYERVKSNIMENDYEEHLLQKARNAKKADWNRMWRLTTEFREWKKHKHRDEKSD